MIRVAILISGGGSNMVKLVESMVDDHPARPVLVVSNKAGVAGLDRARALKVPTLTLSGTRSKQVFEAALDAALKAADVDLICLAGFMRILSPAFVAEWEGRILNIHPSLLPKYKGLDTHARALAAGDAEHGCTVHHVTADLDDGPILGQTRVPVLAGDSADALAARVLVEEHKLYPNVLREVANGMKPERISLGS